MNITMLTVQLFAYTMWIVRGLSQDDPNFWSRFIGMLVVSILLGFVIGSGLGIMVFMFIRGFRSDDFPIKKAINIGGLLGAIAGGWVLMHFVLGI